MIVSDQAKTAAHMTPIASRAISLSRLVSLFGGAPGSINVCAASPGAARQAPLLVRVLMGRIRVLVGKLAVFMSRLCVVLRLLVLTEVVVVRRLMVMMGGGVVMRGGRVVVLAGLMRRLCHGNSSLARFCL
jgi:hypothetical protein